MHVYFMHVYTRTCMYILIVCVYTHRRVTLEKWRAEQHLGPDTCEAPNVDRHRVLLGLEDQLGRAIVPGVRYYHTHAHASACASAHALTRTHARMRACMHVCPKCQESFSQQQDLTR